MKAAASFSAAPAALIPPISFCSLAMSAWFWKLNDDVFRFSAGDLAGAIERVGHQHRVALGGNALADVAHRGTKPERVRPDQHGRMRPGRRVNEGRVAGAVRRLDLDAGFHDRQLRRRRRTGRGGQAGGQRQRDEVAP